MKNPKMPSGKPLPQKNMSTMAGKMKKQPSAIKNPKIKGQK